MKDDLSAGVAAAVQALFGVETSVELTRPDPQYGDFATNVALAMASRVGSKPRELAESILTNLPLQGLIKDARVAGPGFINLWVSDMWLHDAVKLALERSGRYGWAARAS